MTATTMRGALKRLCLVLGGAETEITSTSCPAGSSEGFSEKLKVSDECLEQLAVQWTDNQVAAVLDDLRRLTDVLQKQQKTACMKAMPGVCPFPVVHSEGGLACVSVDKKVYCKPMCNEGQDFSFLRRTRVYEECSAATNNTWTTQYVGGNKLAVCNKSNIAISGTPSAYFPKDQDCLRTKRDPALEEKVIETFKRELRDDNIQGNITYTCLLCG